MAAMLHAASPHLYSDSSAMSAIVIAETQLRVLCQFKPATELTATLHLFAEEFSALLGQAEWESIQVALGSGDTKSALQKLFLGFQMASSDAVSTAIEHILSVRARGQIQSPHYETNLLRLVEELNGQHPNDVGILVALLLNDVLLSPGDALFIPHGEPYAFLEGDALLASNCSGNVIRAGLTTEYRDLQV